MCIIYTSLNKACSKDEYPLPHICQIVDSTLTCELLLFMDAYSGYHQIILATDDEEKIHHSVRDFLLHQDGIWVEKWGGGLHIRSTYTSSWKIRLEETLKPTLIILW
jgi:hypothetical protein